MLNVGVDKKASMFFIEPKDGAIRLQIEGMNDLAIKALGDLMLLNKAHPDELRYRSFAGAHLEAWDSALGSATVVMYGDNRNLFLYNLETLVGASIEGL